MSDTHDPPAKRRRVASPPASPAMVFTSISLSKYFTFQLDNYKPNDTKSNDHEMVESSHTVDSKVVFFDMSTLPTEVSISSQSLFWQKEAQ